MALMGRPVIQELNVLPFLREVSTMKESSSVPERYTPLFQDQLEKIKATYKIELSPHAKTFAVINHRRVPIPPLLKVRQELDRMKKKLGAIERVKHATQWCAPIIVATKTDNTLRICVNCT